MLETLIELITKNGIGVICLAVVLYDHINFQSKLVDTLSDICKRLIKIEDTLEINSDDEEEEDHK